MWAGFGGFVPASVVAGLRRGEQLGPGGGGKEQWGQPWGFRLWKEFRGGGGGGTGRDGLWAGTPRRALLLSSGGVGDGLVVVRDAGATVLVLVGAYSLVRGFDFLTSRRVVSQKVSRKAVHILSGILFMSSWPIFSSSAEARFFASFIPFLNCTRLVIYGFSLAKNEGLIRSLTRKGKPEELLRGPLYYVVVLLICALVFWRDSPVGIISLSMMSGGDGFADIMGRRYGQIKLPYNKHKSWVGSLCMFATGFSLSMVMLYYFYSLGYLQLEWDHAAKKVGIISLAATVVESLPITDFVDDNISVPLCSILVAYAVFGL